MPGRSRGRAAAPQREAAYPDYPGYGDHPDDDGYDDYDEGPDAYAPPPARRNGSAGNAAPPRRPRNGQVPPGRGPAHDDDGHEPLYARDHTPLGYDGGDPDDPPLLTHGGTGRGPARDPRAAGYDEYEDDDYEDGDEYDDDLEDEYDEYDDDRDDSDDEDYYDDEAYDDDAYGVGDGPLAVPPPGSGGRPLGPADVEELDPSMTDALARVDLGSMQVPVPFGADLSLEPAEGGRPQAVHLMLPEGRIAVSALAAPRSSGLWSELVDEIEESLRTGGARVRGGTGDWGRELHARTDNASSVFIGADGPRWMVYGVATAALETIDALDVELRRVMRGIIVVRGKLPYPPRTVLPLERAEDRAAAESAAQGKPRPASITVSVPAARTSGTSGATPAAAAAEQPDAPSDARTTRTPVARNGASGPGRPGAAAGRPARSPDRPDTPAGRPDAPARRPAASRPERPAAAQAERPAGRPERPAASRPERPAAAQAERPAGRPERPSAARAERPGRGPVAPARGPAPSEQRSEQPSEQTIAARVRRDPGEVSDTRGVRGVRAAADEPGTGRHPRTGGRPDARPSRGGVEDTGAAPVGRALEDTGASTPRIGVERTGSVRPRGPVDATGSTPRSGAGGSSPARGRTEDAGHRGGDAPLSTPARPRMAEDEPEPPVTRMLPAVEAPGAGHTDAHPIVPRATERATEPAVEQAAERSQRVEARPAPEFAPVEDVVDEPPARRDPAVMSLPVLPGVDVAAGIGPDRSDRSNEDRDPLTPAAGLPADEPTPRGGTRHATGDPWTPVDAGDPEPAWRDTPAAAPVSRMAIEDIPLSDVELLDATLDSVPVAPPEPPAPEQRLPRRRPGATRRAAAPPATPERAGRRRRGAEDDVLSDWMSAEIAARPTGRHAQPGRSTAGGDGAPRRSTGGRRAADRQDPRHTPDEDLFRPVNGASAGGGEDRADGRPRHNGRARNGTGAVDPMTLFSAARDPGRHRRG